MNARCNQLTDWLSTGSRSLLITAVVVLWSAIALAGPHGKGTVDEDEKFLRDRKAILAMAGNYHVRFSFRETVSFVEGYKLKEPYEPDGYEIVRVIRDDADFISLQHILVVQGIWGDPMPMKHWRQDWVYEPEHMFEYVGHNVWRTRRLDEAERQGKWANSSTKSMMARAMQQSRIGRTTMASPPGPHRRRGDRFPDEKRKIATTMMS